MIRITFEYATPERAMFDSVETTYIYDYDGNCLFQTSDFRLTEFAKRALGISW